jgi:hypothetical protein
VAAVAESASPKYACCDCGEDVEPVLTVSPHS